MVILVFCVYGVSKFLAIIGQTGVFGTGPLFFFLLQVVRFELLRQEAASRQTVIFIG